MQYKKRVNKNERNKKKKKKEVKLFFYFTYPVDELAKTPRTNIFFVCFGFKNLVNLNLLNFSIFERIIFSAKASTE